MNIVLTVEELGAVLAAIDLATEEAFTDGDRDVLRSADGKLRSWADGQGWRAT